MRLIPSCVPPALLALLAVVTSAFATVADDLCPPAADPCIVNTAVTLTPGSTIDLGGRALHFGAAARVAVGVGAVVIQAGPVRLLPDARITGGAGLAGSTLEITSSGSISVESSGGTRSRIDMSADLITGAIALTAAGGITVAGDLVADGRHQDADGGFIMLDAVAGDVLVTGSLSVKGGSLSGGGTIFVGAGGAVDLATEIDLSGGDFGGGELDVIGGGNVIVRQDILAGGGGFSGDGGAFAVDALGSITVLGTFKGEAAGDSEEGGGTGGDVELNADGDVTVSGQLQLTGGFPDGEGGSVFVQTGGSFVHTAAIILLGNGIDGCGGSFDVSAARDVTLARIDASGGSCGGGDVTAQALGTLRAGGLISADATTGLANGGVIVLIGRDVVTNAVVRANGGSQSFAGFISLQGCTITINQSSEIRTTGGIGGGNTLRASGRATIRGKLLTAGGGVNTIAFRDPALPPIVTGEVNPPTLPVLDPALPLCPGETAACGDGNLDPGEQCDDANTGSCDGCSASCRQEGCGNGRVECDEECDAGPLNGAPGSGCDATCTVVALPGGILLLPGGRTRNSCMSEWQIKNPGGEVNDGFPSKNQSCIDGDPTCDQDAATDGKCVFQVGVCNRVTDARLPECNPTAVESISINKPNLLSPPNPVDAANGVALRTALATLGMTVKAGTNVLVPGVPDLLRDHCAPPAAITVPHPPGLAGARELNIAARDGAGARMRENAVNLICTPNTAVCGNGMQEIGEQCDDGDQDACDGCAPTCRLEVCGDGIVECSEQCDDGPANGTPESRCTVDCTEVVPALRSPGGGSPRTDCLLELAVDTQTPTLKRDGLPSNKQECLDNDPGCDFDPNPGTCRFHVWLCLGAADARIGCSADSVASVELRKPSERDSGAPAALRQAVVQRLGGFALPLPPGERCTTRVDVDVPAGRKDGKLSLRIRNPLGDRDTDNFKFKCVAPDS